jgi:hypothetical protein
MTLRISTPGAHADAVIKSQSASVWEFDTTSLDNTKIDLVNNQLLIGHTVIHLPSYNDPEDLIDQVRVITPDGIVYTVDLAFDAVYIDSLDARYFKGHLQSETAVLQELTSIGKEEIAVRNIVMRDGTPGTLSYNLSKRRWILDTDKTRTVRYEDVLPLNRCVHQLEHCYALMEHGANTTPPVSAADLRILLDACKAL